MKEKKEKKQEKKTVAKIDTIIAAYNILTMRRNAQTGEEGIKLSALDTKDMYRVLKAMYIIKNVAIAFTDFQKEIHENESLKPENWNEIQEKLKPENYKQLSLEERVEFSNIKNSYTKKCNECILAELDREKELEPYEHLSEESFGILVQNNEKLEACDIMVLKEILA